MQLEDYRALLSFSRALAQVSTVEELIEVSVAALGRHTPYRAGWLYLCGEDGSVELLASRGESEESRRETVSNIAADDPFVQMIIRSKVPVVIEDARTDPRTNKTIVERLGNRTLVNVPLLLHDAYLGVFGGGTFGDQGVHVPTEEELAFISTMSGLIASVLARLRAEKRLQASQRLESLGLMAGKIAHDFNNILTVVSSRLDLARSAHPGDEHVVEASRATKMAAELSHQLLAYSGRGKLASRPVDLVALVEAMTSLLEASLAPGVRLSMTLPKVASAVEGDASQLRQVIHNLVINASDALRSRGGEITLDLFTEGGRVCLVVGDHGVGMDAVTRAKLFDPFFTTKSTGRGLGMAAVLGICRAHGGTIDVKTVPEEGTTITVSFPRIEPQAPVREVLAPRPLSGAGRILVVDDDDGVRLTMQSVFESVGHEVITASNGPDALRIVEENPEAIDLAYVDLTMPSMNGIEVLAALGRLRPKLKAILTSGYTDLDVSNVGDVDLIGVVPKPPDVARLLAMVDRALRDDESPAAS